MDYFLQYPNKITLLHYLFILCIISSYVSVYLRIRRRKLARQTLGPEDPLLLATLASFSAYIAFACISTNYGLDIQDDSRSRDPVNMSSALQAWLLSELAFIVTTALLRVSACIYLRALAKTLGLRRLISILFVISIIANCSYFLFILKQCSPIHYFWTSWTGSNGYCLDASQVANVTYIFCLVSAFSDFSLALLPLWTNPGRENNAKFRRGRNILMALGFFAGFAALIRIPCTAHLLKSDDFFYDRIYLVITSMLEPAFGIMALSASTVAPTNPVLHAHPLASTLSSSDMKLSIIDDQQAEGTGAHTAPRTTIKWNTSQENCGV